MGLFRWLAGSRARLAIAVAIGIAAVLGGSLPLASFIRDSSMSPVANLLLMLGWAFFVLATGYLGGILLSDLLLPGRWRERVYLELEVGTDDDELVPLNSYKLQFGLLTLLAMAGLVIGSNALTAGFFGEIGNAHKRTVLRGAEEVQKLELVDELADVKFEEKVVEAIDLLELAWRDESQSAAVRTAACRALSQLSRYLVRAVKGWVAQGITRHWEMDGLAKLRKEQAPALLEIFHTHPDGPLASAAALALGAMRHEPAVEALLAYAEGSAKQPEAKTAASIAAIGLMRFTTTTERLAKLATQVSGLETFQSICWALGQVVAATIVKGDTPKVFEPIIAYFGDVVRHDKDYERRCVAANVLARVQAAEIAAPLMAAFEDAATAEVKCAFASVDIGADAPETILAESSLRFRLLKSLSEVAKGNKEILAWAKDQLNAPTLSTDDRLHLRDVVELLGGGRPKPAAP